MWNECGIDDENDYEHDHDNGHFNDGNDIKEQALKYYTLKLA